MERRKQTCKETRKQASGAAAAVRAAGRSGEECEKERRIRLLLAQQNVLPIIEVSDADYRTLHLPCEALEEKEGDKPGK